MKHHDQSQKRHLKSAANSLFEAMASINSAAEAEMFLSDLCTPAEVEAMIDRWRVAQLLDQGHTYRDIAELTEVSVTTIGRVARFIEFGQGGYRAVLDRFRSRQA